MRKEEKRAFLRIFTLTALPVVLQNLLQNSLTFVDTLMIGRLGETSIAAVGIASQVYFLVFVALFGIASGSSIFHSQFWGSSEYDNIQKATGIGLALALLIASVFSFLSVVTPSLVTGLFVDDPEVSALGCIYLRWVGISYLFTSVSLVLSSLLRSTGDTKTPMLVTLVSMLLNIGGDYLLIFVFKMGVKGAAIATALSRFVEAFTLTLILSLTKKEIRLNLRKMLGFDRAFVRRFSTIAIPVIADDIFWALGLTVYKMVYARMGVGVLAASTVIGTIQDLFFVLQNAIGSATAILIGNSIGRAEKDKAYEMSVLCAVYGVIGGLVMGVLMVLTRNLIPPMFALSGEVNTYVSNTMIILGILLPVRFLNHVYVIGILRSGGDTRFVFYLELVSIWAVGVPLSILSGLVWKVPIWYVYAFTGLEEVFKVFLAVIRFRSGKWIHVLSSSGD